MQSFRIFFCGKIFLLFEQWLISCLEGKNIIFITSLSSLSYRVSVSIHKGTLNKKWCFLLRISSVNVTKSAGNCDFATFTEEILSGKLQFFVQWKTMFLGRSNTIFLNNTFSKYFWEDNLLRALWKKKIGFWCSVLSLTLFACFEQVSCIIQKQPFRGVLRKRCSENMQ